MTHENVSNVYFNSIAKSRKIAWPDTYPSELSIYIMNEKYSKINIYKVTYQIQF